MREEAVSAVRKARDPEARWQAKEVLLRPVQEAFLEGTPGVR